MRRSIVYPYSVIAGGVESRVDVRAAAESDPEIARHYEDVNIDGLEPVNLKSDTLAYVSFRKAGQIYWTSRQVRLSKGERILSDGRNCVRGRCGNRISWQPRGPVLPKQFREPGSAQFNTPEVRGQSIDELPLPAVFATELSVGELPVSIGGILDATAIPSPWAPAFIGAVDTGGGQSGSGGGGGGAGGGAGAGDAQSGAGDVLSPSNFVPAVLVALTGVVVPPISVSTVTPPIRISTAPAPYSPAAASTVPPITWTAPPLRVEIPGSTVVQWTTTPNNPPYGSSTPSTQTPPGPQIQMIPVPPVDADSLKPTPAAPPSDRPSDTPSEAAVPEPATLALMTAGLAGLLAVGLRRSMKPKRAVTKR
jgi:hypothetical protein